MGKGKGKPTLRFSDPEIAAPEELDFFGKPNNHVIHKTSFIFPLSPFHLPPCMTITHILGHCLIYLGVAKTEMNDAMTTDYNHRTLLLEASIF